MKIYGKTDVGRVRQSNQDSFGFKIVDENFSWAVVCDGVGGTNSGDVASKLAVETMDKELVGLLKRNTKIKDTMAKAVKKANENILNKANEDALCAGMGTTIVLVVVKDGIAHVAHVGDSRAYLVSNGEILQITVDHSIVQKMLESGEITKEEAKVHPKKNIITRALGTNINIDIDYMQCKVKIGDIILICTDGLSNYFEKEELLEALKSNNENNLVDELITHANIKGGSDNITAVVIIN